MPDDRSVQTNAPTAADVIARRLYDAGCRFAFGIPGGEVLTLLDAVHRAGIRFVLTKHENCAGLMAHGTYFADGAPGILVATVGPGAANAINAVVNAEQDRVPLVFLTGCVDPADAQTYTHQVFDHRAVLAPITKANFTVLDGAADVIIDKALAIAMDDQPGPVHIDVPIKAAITPQTGAPAQRRVRPAMSAPVGPDLETARAWLAEAERPVIIAGVDVLNQGAADTVAAFARDLGIPLFTTYNAKGMLPEDDALSLGGIGLSPKADEFVHPFLRQCDLILLAGYDPIEMRDGWRTPWDGDARVVEFTAVPNTHYVHQARLSFVGHVGAGLDALREGAVPHPIWPQGEAAALRAALKDAFIGDQEWGAAAVIDVARRVLPRHGVATVDTGAHRILLNQMWECYGPRQLLQSTGLGTMGIALPLAIGHKLAKPDLPVIAFTGDAGLEMVMGELATVRDLGIAFPIVVFVDRSLALIELKQRDRKLDNLGVDFGGTDFPALAEAMGGTGVLVDSRDGLTAALEAALASDKFSIIACDIGYQPYEGRF